MPFQLSNCIEKLAKSGRVVIISKSVVRINDTDKSKENNSIQADEAN